MKKLTQLSTLLILSLALCALVATAAPPSDPTLDVTCTFVQGSLTDCVTGLAVTITGGKFSGGVLLEVIDPNGLNIENGIPYRTPGGSLTAQEAPVINGVYTVNAYDKKGNLVATTSFPGATPVPQP